MSNIYVTSLYFSRNFWRLLKYSSSLLFLYKILKIVLSFWQEFENLNLKEIIVRIWDNNLFFIFYFFTFPVKLIYEFIIFKLWEVSKKDLHWLLSLNLFHLLMQVCLSFLFFFFNDFSSCSSFTSHVGHKLSKEEVDNLTQRKWKYNWEMPAFDMSSCKWMGTGESFLKVYLSFVLFTCLMSFYCLRIHLQHSLF